MITTTDEIELCIVATRTDRPEAQGPGEVLQSEHIGMGLQ